MSSDPVDDRRALFVDLLNAAITTGRTPRGGSGLGPVTTTALQVVAAEHPDATVDSIADAYDAFSDEHR